MIGYLSTIYKNGNKLFSNIIRYPFGAIDAKVTSVKLATGAFSTIDSTPIIYARLGMLILYHIEYYFVIVYSFIIYIYFSITY